MVTDCQIWQPCTAVSVTKYYVWGGGIHGGFAILKKEVLLLEINIFNCSQSFYESKEQIKSFRRL